MCDDVLLRSVQLLLCRQCEILRNPNLHSTTTFQADAVSERKNFRAYEDFVDKRLASEDERSLTLIRIEFESELIVSSKKKNNIQSPLLFIYCSLVCI